MPNELWPKIMHGDDGWLMSVHSMSTWNVKEFDRKPQGFNFRPYHYKTSTVHYTSMPKSKQSKKDKQW